MHGVMEAILGQGLWLSWGSSENQRHCSQRRFWLGPELSDGVGQILDKV
jgi:hypothetical protein